MISKACGVKEIDDLGPAIYRAMSYDLDSWQHPYNELPISRAKKRQRIEFYSWLGGLEPGARVIRYGCELRCFVPVQVRHALRLDEPTEIQARAAMGSTTASNLYILKL